MAENKKIGNSVFRFEQEAGIDSKLGNWRNGKTRESKPPVVSNIAGPYDQKTKKKISGGIIKGKSYYYYATLKFQPTPRNIKRVKWAISYDDNDVANSFYLFSGGKIVNNKVRISLNVEKGNDKFRLYAYTTYLPNNKEFLEVRFYKKETVKEEPIKFPFLILQSNNKKGKNKKNTGKHNDLKFNDYTEDENGLAKLKKQLLTEVKEPWIFGTKDSEAEDIIEKFRDTYFNESNSDLFDFWRDEVEYFAQGDLEDIVKIMINKVQENKGGSYSHSTLTKEVKEHENTKTFIKKAKKAIEEELKKVKGDIRKLTPKIVYTNFLEEQEADALVLGDKTGGLGIIINTMWAYEVYLTKYSPTSFQKGGKKGNIKLELQFRFYDHFGLDFPDLAKYPNYDIFYAWFMLQHFRGFKPLITTIKFTETLKITI